MSENLPNLHLRRDDLLRDCKWPTACKPPAFKQDGVALELYIPAQRIRELVEKWRENANTGADHEDGAYLSCADELEKLIEGEK